jgi:hypothetical protein
MPANRETKAERDAKAKALWHLHHEARETQSAKIVSGAVAALRPDMQIAEICGDLPVWFRRVVFAAQLDAAREAIRSAPRGERSDEAGWLTYDAAYITSFAEAYPRLLGRALAKHEKATDPAA